MTRDYRFGLAAAAMAAILMGTSCGPSGPRVFFVQPQDGATVKSPVNLEFGAEDFTIAAVPQGTLTETRPSLGHYTSGCILTACLRARYPSAGPGVHSATESVIECNSCGTHKLTCRLVTDLHDRSQALLDDLGHRDQ